MTDLATGAGAPANDDLRSTLESAFTVSGRPDEANIDPAAGAPDAKPGGAGENADHDGAAAAARSAARKPPASWSKEVHAHWDRLDPAIQDHILKRESDVARGFEEKAERLKPYEDLDRIFQPHRQRWQLNGWSDAQAVQQLLAAQDYLERDPAGAIRWLAQSYGLTPEQLAQNTAASEDNLDPLAQYLAPVFQELAQVKATLTAREHAERVREHASVRDEIESFKQDHPHFVAARPTIATLLSTGHAQNLQDAYDKAIWLDPDIRRQILDDQAREQAGRAAQDSARARRAASSVTGAPTGPASGGPRATLREELEAAFG